MPTCTCWTRQRSRATWNSSQCVTPIFSHPPPFGAWHTVSLDPISGSVFYLAVTALIPTPPDSACGITGRLTVPDLTCKLCGAQLEDASRLIISSCPTLEAKRRGPYSDMPHHSCRTWSQSCLTLHVTQIYWELSQSKFSKLKSYWSIHLYVHTHHCPNNTLN